MLHWNDKGMDSVGVSYFCSVIALMNAIFCATQVHHAIG